MIEPGGVVEPLRVDDGARRRQALASEMMIDDDDIEARRCGGRQRLVRGHAAVDGDDQRYPLPPQLQQRRRVRAIPLAQPVGNVQQRRGAHRREKAQQQRRGGRPVDIIVAEDGDALARLDRLHEPFRAGAHVLQPAGIGQELAQRRRKEGVDLADRDAARRQHPRDDLRQAMTLGEGDRQPLINWRKRPAPTG